MSQPQYQPLVERRDRVVVITPKKVLAIGTGVTVISTVALTGLILALINSTNLSGSSNQQLPDNRHTVYIRWGHSECPSTPGTTLVYRGFAASPDLTSGTPTPVSQCLPENDSYVNYYNDSASLYGGTIVYKLQGVSYETFIMSQNHMGVACALCKVRTRDSVVMIPATSECISTDPSDKTWTKEYSGYLMIGSGAGSEYYCVDSAMEGMAQNSNAAHLNHVVTNNIPPQNVYNDTKVLSCVVCTI